MTRVDGGSSILGILGGGQLGRMLALAGLPLGYRFRFLEPNGEPPAAEVGEVIRAAYSDPDALVRFADGLQAVTYEFENVPAEAVLRLQETVPVFPPPEALEVGRDRLREKRMFQRLGIGTAAFVPIDDRDQILRGLDAVGLPAVLKTRTLGYDGKGQRVIQDRSEVDAAWSALGERPLILEQFVRFRRELSVLGVRDQEGRSVFYPLGWNEHRSGILRVTRAPVPGLSEALQARAEEFSRKIMEDLGYVGVLALELFETDEGLLANEIAPRVHNSGHWTQDGAETSQFENHLRAVGGMPLGRPDARGWTAMVNLIGTVPDRARILDVPGSRLHLYGKEPRRDRKLGHVNLIGTSPEAVEARLVQVLDAVQRSTVDLDQATQVSQSP